MNEKTNPGRWRPLRSMLASVRARTTVVAMLVVGAALAFGGFELVHLLSDVLVGNVDNQVHSSLSALATKVTAGEISSALAPVPGDSFAQIVDPTGLVISATANIAGNAPIGPYRTSVAGGSFSGAVLVQERSLPSNDDGPFVVGYLALSTPSGPVTVYVASSLATANSSIGTVKTALSEGLPVLVVLVGLLSWLMAGRALRPVETMRRSVADASGGDLGFRIPQTGARDEVGRLARTMNSMLERLESEAGRRRKLVSDASHELRSPIASIQANLEVAQVHPNGTDWLGLVDVLTPECERMARIVDDLLTLAKADEGNLVQSSRPVDLDEIVLAEGRRLRMAGRVGINLAGVSGARVSGDGDQLAGMVRNLVDNASRHAESAVTLELYRSGPDVVLVVADDGTGIAPDQRHKVFERFVRLDDARSRDSGGSGLGLAIVREIAQAHHGTVEVADAEVGARLVVRLPTSPD
ncbi:MAG: ATP-binding protein [Acidimicrobiales bacterium]